MINCYARESEGCCNSPHVLSIMQTVSQQCKNIKCGGQNTASANDFAWTA